MKITTECGFCHRRARTVAAAAFLAAAVSSPARANNFAPDIEVIEGNDATFKITMPFALRANVRWSYETEDGTATWAQDYSASSGHLVMQSGDMTGAVEVETSGDSVADDGETFKLRLYNLQMQRGNGQWVSERVFGLPSEKTITATIKE